MDGDAVVFGIQKDGYKAMFADACFFLDHFFTRTRQRKERKVTDNNRLTKEQLFLM